MLTFITLDLPATERVMYAAPHFREHEQGALIIYWNRLTEWRYQLYHNNPPWQFLDARGNGRYVSRPTGSTITLYPNLRWYRVRS